MSQTPLTQQIDSLRLSQIEEAREKHTDNYIAILGRQGDRSVSNAEDVRSMLTIMDELDLNTEYVDGHVKLAISAKEGRRHSGADRWQDVVRNDLAVLSRQRHQLRRGVHGAATDRVNSASY